jgi:hypothetical protein
MTVYMAVLAAPMVTRGTLARIQQRFRIIISPMGIMI